MKHLRKRLIAVVLTMTLAISLTGCSFEGFNNTVNEMEGSIKGCTYNCMFYSNTGNLFMTATGEQIDLRENIVKERTYDSESGWGYNETLSSVITIVIDGSEMVSCGSTILFAEDNLTPDVDFTVSDIESHADGSIKDWTSVAAVVNKYKNFYGAPKVVVIQSQLGDPICAYSGESVYWEVCQDLPKTTKLMIDGKALYIHRANFQLINKNLLN